jgi:hypothetical protein
MQIFTRIHVEKKKEDTDADRTPHFKKGKFNKK